MIDLKTELKRNSWFMRAGAWVLVDGQYGSTGKGVIAGALAEAFGDKVDLVVTNAGPNSGHTSFYKGEKIVLKQFPTYAVVARKMGLDIPVHFSGGAVINLSQLSKEEKDHNVQYQIHPSAAVIREGDIQTDRANVSAIASTGQGVGPAIQQKLSRRPKAVYGTWNVNSAPSRSSLHLKNKVCFFEVSQGFSLGINSGFYPHTTTRECTVSQALADAGFPPTSFRKSIMSVRTFPIRVGDTENTSGPCYMDQMELTWEELGQEPETTTVTGRIRRVFTWSNIQFEHAVWANQPSAIFLNFCNYLRPDDVDSFVHHNVYKSYIRALGRAPEVILLGFGPNSSDIQVWEGRRYA